MEKKTRSIYILRLEGGKYYIGTTNNVLHRVMEHMAGAADLYTKQHKPLEIEEIIHFSNCNIEDTYVFKYMTKYGINNVRGGSYTSPTLSPETINNIRMKINTPNDVCFLCGNNLHFRCNCSVEQVSNSTDENIECNKFQGIVTSINRTYEWIETPIITYHKYNIPDNELSEDGEIELNVVRGNIHEPSIITNCHKYKVAVNDENEKECFNCRKIAHESYDCPSNSCFKCNKPGHRASDCPTATRRVTKIFLNNKND